MTTPVPFATPGQEIGASTDSVRHGHTLSSEERVLCGVLGEECEVWGLVCAAYGLPAKAAPSATSYQARRFTRSGNPIFFPVRSREGLDLPSQTEPLVQAEKNASSNFEPLNDTTARKKRVVRKTPLPPMHRSQSTSEIGALSQDDISGSESLRLYLIM